MTDVPMAGTSELDLGRCISEGPNSECSGWETRRVCELCPPPPHKEVPTSQPTGDEHAVDSLLAMSMGGRNGGENTS